jgi:hypothetical protein
MLIKPFTGIVNTSGQGVVNVGHTLSNIAWKVYQVGFALGVLAPSPQVAAHVNGVPLTATTAMQPSVFANITGQAPYAMESFFVGPPYIILSSGDQMVCAVLGASSGDTFTAAAYIEEYDATDTSQLYMGT